MRHSVLLMTALLAPAACGDSADDLAFARCKDEIHKMLGSAAVAEVAGAGSELRNDPIYGWHLDIETSSHDRAKRAGYRCLFLVEGRLPSSVRRQRR